VRATLLKCPANKAIGLEFAPAEFLHRFLRDSEDVATELTEEMQWLFRTCWRSETVLHECTKPPDGRICASSNTASGAFGDGGVARWMDGEWTWLLRVTLRLLREP